jgi:uncharacterized membrane protein
MFDESELTENQRYRRKSMIQMVIMIAVMWIACACAYFFISFRAAVFPTGGTILATMITIMIYVSNRNLEKKGL